MNERQGFYMVIIRSNPYNPEKEALVTNKDNTTCKKYTGGYGIAIDIGTTTIAASLFSLDSRKYCGNITETNIQTKYGADVMMRIMNANMGKASLLHNIIITQTEDIIERLSNGICAMDKVAQMAVTGNTTMCHLFLDKDLSGMAGTPFKPAYTGSASLKGSENGFKKFPDIDIYVMPGIEAHTGADAVSVICSQKLYQTDKVQLAVDIGTNAEIILNNKGNLFACSAAAGPAFEGKGVQCGTRAGNGAINGIKINRLAGNIVLDVIDTSNNTNSSPGQNIQDMLILKGICGSGLVDAIAELLKTGVLKTDGYLISKEEALQNGINPSIAERIHKNNEGNYFVFYGKNDFNNKQLCDNRQHDILITQKDIRNIQLAKAAIQAATEILLKTAGITLNDIDEVKIAGVFGKFIHPKQAVLIGLYPDTGNIEFTGNSAGNGAAQALFDQSFRDLALKYSRETTHIELANEKSFQDKFLNAMDLKKW
ncbi:MAG: ATP-binding protein [Lachnospiraceae bacterium]|nr:ATP-binding protein [Lachnospiraceae bacterium]